MTSLLPHDRHNNHSHHHHHHEEPPNPSAKKRQKFNTPPQSEEPADININVNNVNNNHLAAATVGIPQQQQQQQVPDVSMSPSTPFNDDDLYEDLDLGGEESEADIQLYEIKPETSKRRADAVSVESAKTYSGGGGGWHCDGHFGLCLPEEGKTGEEVDRQRPVVRGGDDDVAMKGKKNIIDLTLDDDEDVQMLNEKKGVEVCFGMIHNASALAHTIPAPAFGTDKFASNWPWIPITLVRGGNPDTLIVHTVDPMGRQFGCIDINSARALSPLLDLKLVRTQARIIARPKRQGQFVGCPTSSHMPVYINLYGLPNNKEIVGNLLSQKNTFLQKPLQCDDNVEYMNPQEPDSPELLWGSRAIGARGGGAYVSRTAEEIRADVNDVFDGLVQSENLPEMEPDEQITTPLLKHQKQGLYFMMTKEKEREFNNSSLWRLRPQPSGGTIYLNVITGEKSGTRPAEVLGGILADMMGLGKTLQILSLVVTSMEAARAFGKMKRLPQMDVGEDAPVIHAKTTLLVSPLSTIGNWEEQIAAHVEPKALSFYVYHGGKRETSLERLTKYDLIITTYQVVANEHKNQRLGKKSSPLQQIDFFRIVLDEAHMIREQRTQQSKAILALTAQRRWAVTGTPVQNRLDDLAALIKFLRIKPFDDKSSFNQYIANPFKCADPECVPRLRLLVDSVTLRRLKDRINLPPRKDQIIFLEFNPDEKEIYNATIKQSSARMDLVAKSGHMGGKAYVHVLQSILRLRLICAHGRELLGEDDTAGLTSSDAIDVDEIEEKGSSLSSKQAYDMFRLMKEANEDVCSVCRVKVHSGNIDDNNNPDAKLGEGGGGGRTIGHITPCAHLLCTGCLRTYTDSISVDFKPGQQASCPICGIFIRVDIFDLKSDHINSELLGGEGIEGSGSKGKKVFVYRGPSTKVSALLKALLDSREESTPGNRIKSVVFSCWTTHMDLIAMAFKDSGIKYVRLDGTLTRAHRNEAIAVFREDPDVEVILVSLMAGGLGLNLTAACRVYVMEPQFNPACEAQAIDRIHRLGQTRPVTTVRYIMAGSFEEKIMDLQKKKTDLANLSLAQGKKLSKGQLMKQRLEGLRSLFK